MILHLPFKHATTLHMIRWCSVLHDNFSTWFVVENYFVPVLPHILDSSGWLSSSKLAWLGAWRQFHEDIKKWRVLSHLLPTRGRRLSPNFFIAQVLLVVRLEAGLGWHVQYLFSFTNFFSMHSVLVCFLGFTIRTSSKDNWIWSYMCVVFFSCQFFFHGMCDFFFFLPKAIQGLSC